MKLRTTILMGSCAILLCGLRATAQDIVLPAAGAPAVAAPAGPNLWTMLLPPPEMRERCRQKLCKCEVIKLMKASLAAPSAMTGGIIPYGNCCPAIKKEDLAKPADSAEGAAARIMKDAEEAAARRAAVRILGTVDCRYWPEAEDGLIAALRADKIECVRFEAALQLQRGCCCTKKIAKALTITIEGSDKDGFPAERSERVRNAATVALSNCVFEDKVEPKELPEGDKKRQARVDPKEFYKSVENAPAETIKSGARKALESRGPLTSTKVISQTHLAASQGLFGMMGHAIESANDSAVTAPTREPQPVASAAPACNSPTCAPATEVATQPERRGLLNKLFAKDDQPAATPPSQTVIQVSSQTTTLAAPQTIVSPPPVKLQPVTSTTPVMSQPTLPPMRPTQLQYTPLSSAPPQRLPVGDIRPVSFSTPAPAYGRMSDEPQFSTAGPNPSLPRPMPSTSAPSVPATPAPANQSSANSVPQGQLGLVVITDDPPTRR